MLKEFLLLNKFGQGISLMEKRMEALWFKRTSFFFDLMGLMDCIGRFSGNEYKQINK